MNNDLRGVGGERINLEDKKTFEEPTNKIYRYVFSHKELLELNNDRLIRTCIMCGSNIIMCNKLNVGNNRFVFNWPNKSTRFSAPNKSYGHFLFVLLFRLAQEKTQNAIEWLPRPVRSMRGMWRPSI